jgi:hypothetical protein
MRTEKAAIKEFRSRLYYRGTKPTSVKQASISRKILREEEARGFRVRGAYLRVSQGTDLSEVSQGTDLSGFPKGFPRVSQGFPKGFPRVSQGFPKGRTFQAISNPFLPIFYWRNKTNFCRI